MIKPSHLRKLIHDTLELWLPEMNSPEAVELLMMTSAQESWCGRYLQQEGCGVALGIFQIEPTTYRDLWDNFIRYNKSIGDRLFSAFKIGHESFSVHLRGNLPYQIIIARLNYYRFPAKIPSFDSEGKPDTLAMAQYYKKYWNTVKGKATIPEVLRNYDKYAI